MSPSPSSPGPACRGLLPLGQATLAALPRLAGSAVTSLMITNDVRPVLQAGRSSQLG